VGGSKRSARSSCVGKPPTMSHSGGDELPVGVVDEGAAESVKELRRAAVWGDKDAQFSLGLCYHEGCGVAKNHVEAAWWFRRAAKQGHEVAESMIESAESDGGELSDLHDEDSDGWEFLDDDEPAKTPHHLASATIASTHEQECAPRRALSSRVLGALGRRRSEDVGEGSARHEAWEMLNRELGAVIDEWEERVVYVPEGRMYTTFVSSIAGPKLHKICNKMSPLFGQIVPGDVILSVDDQDVSGKSGPRLGEILRSKADAPRRLTIRTSIARRMLYEQEESLNGSLPRVVSVGSV